MDMISNVIYKKYHFDKNKETGINELEFEGERIFEVTV